MGLFDFLKKKSAEKLTEELVEQPLAYWEEKSHMIVIPHSGHCSFDDGVLDRISGIEGVKVTEFTMPHESEEGAVKLTYEGEEYNVDFFWNDFSMPQFLQQPNQFFTEDEINTLKKADSAAGIVMKFGSKPKKAYHLQLKIAEKIVPDLAAIYDESAEKLLCSRWVRQAAHSYVLPSTNSLFTVQAVLGKNDEVWLHTHGLARCGLTELEILQSDRESSNTHYNVITTLAESLMNGSDKDNMAFIGRLSNGEPLVVKYLLWTEGLKQYKKLALGGAADRREEHNSKTSLIFAYKNESDAEKGILTKIPDIKVLSDNPLFFISTEETQRMSMLAREKYECLKIAVKSKDNHILVKVGLQTASNESLEHIWFELLDFDGDAFNGELTQEPYDVPGMHTGDRGTYTVNDVTDWIVYTPDNRITPETAYLLM